MLSHEFDPIWVPNTFIKKRPEAIKPWSAMTVEQKQHFAKHKALIKGDESEEASFTNLSRVLSQKRYRKNRIFVFNGVEFLFPDSDFKTGLVGEFDHIIVDESKNAIIYIELKTTFSRSHAIRKRQFEKFRALVQLHFPMGEGWRLVTAYGFTEWPNSMDEGAFARRPCIECAKNVFFVDDPSSIQRWYDGIGDDQQPDLMMGES